VLSRRSSGHLWRPTRPSRCWNRHKVSEAALDKLGTRTISAEETEQLLCNEHVTVRDPSDETASASRRLLIGRTDGGRALLVITQTLDPTTWLIVTGWESTDSEGRILGTPTVAVHREVPPTTLATRPAPTDAIHASSTRVGSPTVEGVSATRVGVVPTSGTSVAETRPR